MSSHTPWPWRRVPHGRSLPGLGALQWPASIVVNLLIAGALGVLSILLGHGPPRLAPTNIAWFGVGQPGMFSPLEELRWRDVGFDLQRGGGGGRADTAPIKVLPTEESFSDG